VTALAVTAKTRSRTHCANGHEYTADNSHVDATGRRYCNICRLRTPATHCQRGHPFDAANTLVTKKGRRECRTCKNEKARDWYRRKAGPKTVSDRTPRQRTTTPTTPAPSSRPAVTMPDTSQCQRCGDPADHNAGTADAICDPCQTRQHRRAARRRYAVAIGTRP
jgi:hypothetical protein